MNIRCGFDITYFCPVPTPMLFLLSVHPSREADLLGPQELRLHPPTPARSYIDVFGNRVTRLLAPAGPLNLRADFVIADSGEPDAHVQDAREVPVEDLPDDVLIYLLGAAIATRSRSAISPGPGSAARPGAGRGCRPSWTMPMTG